MEKHKIDRINELAHKLKSEGLSDEEHKERKALHREYILDYRKSLGNILDNTYLKRPDGTKEKLKKKTDNNNK